MVVNGLWHVFFKDISWLLEAIIYFCVADFLKSVLQWWIFVSFNHICFLFIVGILFFVVKMLKQDFKHLVPVYHHRHTGVYSNYMLDAVQLLSRVCIMWFRRPNPPFTISFNPPWKLTSEIILAAWNMTALESRCWRWHNLLQRRKTIYLQVANWVDMTANPIQVFQACRVCHSAHINVRIPNDTSKGLRQPEARERNLRASFHLGMYFSLGWRSQVTAYLTNQTCILFAANENLVPNK